MPEGKAQKLENSEYIGKQVIMGIRPENLHDEEAFLSSMPECVIDAKVEVTELMGAEIYLYLNFGEDEEGEPINMISRVSSRSEAKAGDNASIAIDTSLIHFFDKETEKVIIH